MISFMVYVLYTCLYHRGFPVWLHSIPGIVFRNDNEPFKVNTVFKRKFCFSFHWYATRHLVVYTGKNVEFYSRNCRNDEEKISILSTRWPYHIISGSRAIPPYHFFELLLGWWEKQQILSLQEGYWFKLNWLLCCVRSRMNMALLNTIMANLGSVTCIGQQRWLLLLIQVYLGSCANSQMPQPQLWVCTCFTLSYSVFSLSFDSSSTCRLTLGMVSTVIPSTQTLLKNQKYARKLGADGRPIFTLLILWSCKELLYFP